MNKVYFKALSKWAKKKGLKGAKMPRIRKRELAKQMASAILLRHKNNGVS